MTKKEFNSLKKGDTVQLLEGLQDYKSYGGFFFYPGMKFENSIEVVQGITKQLDRSVLLSNHFYYSRQMITKSK